jgi:hypothetical protein
MTSEEIKTFTDWVDQGAKPGNPADLPPVKVFKSFEGGWVNRVPDIVLQPEHPFTVGADVSDLYYCFKIPFGVDQEMWLKGVEFQAGNSEVAHHFILLRTRVAHSIESMPKRRSLAVNVPIWVNSAVQASSQCGHPETWRRSPP